jgi:hypothetical protein
MPKFWRNTAKPANEAAEPYTDISGLFVNGDSAVASGHRSSVGVAASPELALGDVRVDEEDDTPLFAQRPREVPFVEKPELSVGGGSDSAARKKIKPSHGFRPMAPATPVVAPNAWDVDESDAGTDPGVRALQAAEEEPGTERKKRMDDAAALAAQRQAATLAAKDHMDDAVSETSVNSTATPSTPIATPVKKPFGWQQVGGEWKPTKPRPASVELHDDAVAAVDDDSIFIDARARARADAQRKQRALDAALAKAGEDLKRLRPENAADAKLLSSRTEDAEYIAKRIATQIQQIDNDAEATARAAEATAETALKPDQKTAIARDAAAAHANAGSGDVDAIDSDQKHGNTDLDPSVSSLALNGGSDEGKNNEDDDADDDADDDTLTQLLAAIASLATAGGLIEYDEQTQAAQDTANAKSKQLTVYDPLQAARDTAKQLSEQLQLRKSINKQRRQLVHRTRADRARLERAQQQAQAKVQEAEEAARKDALAWIDKANAIQQEQRNAQGGGFVDNLRRLASRGVEVVQKYPLATAQAVSLLGSTAGHYMGLTAPGYGQYGGAIGPSNDPLSNFGADTVAKNGGTVEYVWVSELLVALSSDAVPDSSPLKLAKELSEAYVSSGMGSRCRAVYADLCHLWKQQRQLPV